MEVEIIENMQNIVIPVDKDYKYILIFSIDMDNPARGHFALDSQNLFEMQRDFFKRVEERKKEAGLTSFMCRDDEFLLYNVFPSNNLGHSIMYVSSPQSSANWEIEPLEFKLLGSRIVSEVQKDKRVPIDVEAVDIEGIIDMTHQYSRDYFFRDFQLIYKSHEQLNPSIKFSYSDFTYDPQNPQKVQLDFKAKATSESIRSYTPLFETYFPKCIEAFLPKNNSRVFKDNVDEFRKSLQFRLESALIQRENISSQKVPKESTQKDSAVVLNDFLTREYVKIMDEMKK